MENTNWTIANHTITNGKHKSNKLNSESTSRKNKDLSIQFGKIQVTKLGNTNRKIQVGKVQIGTIKSDKCK